MLTQKDRKKIRSKLDNIYKVSLSKKDIDNFQNETIEIIKNFNRAFLTRVYTISVTNY